jgi:hypothetical protein
LLEDISVQAIVDLLFLERISIGIEGQAGSLCSKKDRTSCANLVEKYRTFLDPVFAELIFSHLQSNKELMFSRTKYLASFPDFHHAGGTVPQETASNRTTDTLIRQLLSNPKSDTKNHTSVRFSLLPLALSTVNSSNFGVKGNAHDTSLPSDQKKSASTPTGNVEKQKTTSSTAASMMKWWQ